MRARRDVSGASGPRAPGARQSLREPGGARQIKGHRDPQHPRQSLSRRPRARNSRTADRCHYARRGEGGAIRRFRDAMGGVPAAATQSQQQPQRHRRDDPDGAGARRDGSRSPARAQSPVHDLHARHGPGRPQERRSASHRQGRVMRQHQGIAAFTTMAMSAGVALALAWTSAAPALAAGGVLRARFNADIRSTDPGTNRDANTDGVMGHVVEGLVAFREDTSIGPMLADSWEISPDDKTYTFHLRKGVKF